jgi:hypothetical protein
MCLFGADFDTDPQYPWAAACILGDQNEVELRRADRLHDSAMTYVKWSQAQRMSMQKRPSAG